MLSVLLYTMIFAIPAIISEFIIAHVLDEPLSWEDWEDIESVRITITAANIAFALIILAFAPSKMAIGVLLSLPLYMTSSWLTSHIHEIHLPRPKLRRKSKLKNTIPFPAEKPEDYTEADDGQQPQFSQETLLVQRDSSGGITAVVSDGEIHQLPTY